LVLLRGDEIDRAGGLIARAFHDDPLLVYCLPDGTERAQRAPAFFATFVRLAHAIGEVQCLPELEGVAVWSRPGRLHETLEVQRQAGFDELPTLIGESALERFGTAYSTVEQRHSETIDADHWFLQLLAVDPGRQGAGLGGRLLAPVLARADEAGLPCYLDNFAERNLAFYGKHGFRVVVNEVEPASRLRFWGMLRDPR
jgi:GNAT superfamily N-acetyltransferase